MLDKSEYIEKTENILNDRVNFSKLTEKPKSIRHHRLFQEPSIRERCLAASRAGFRLVESPWPSLVCGAFRGEEGK